MLNEEKKNQQYSLEQKEKIIKMFLEEGKTYGELSKEYGIPKGTMKMWVHKFRNNRLVAVKKEVQKPIQIDYKQRYEILKKYQAFLKERHEKK